MGCPLTIPVYTHQQDCKLKSTKLIGKNKLSLMKFTTLTLLVCLLSSSLLRNYFEARPQPHLSPNAVLTPGLPGSAGPHGTRIGSLWSPWACWSPLACSLTYRVEEEVAYATQLRKWTERKLT